MELSNPDVEQALIQLANQVFEMEKKLAKLPSPGSLGRNLRRMKQILTEVGFSYYDPIGESYDETRTDCEASISGTETEKLVIQEVIKPIIREGGTFGRIVQRAVVVVGKG